MKGDLGITTAVIFWLCAAVMLISAFLTVILRNLIRATTALLMTLLMTAFVYFVLGAEFLGAVQILMYVGGVVILVLFGVMLTRDVDLHIPFMKPLHTATAFVLSVVTGFTLWKLADHMPKKILVPLNRPVADTLGELFLNKYIIAFEVASVLLVGVLIGAAYLVRREVREE